MAFFKQLRLLLWKNGLRVTRQPLWSLTLIVWPLIIFIIIAVTRNQFPPVVKQTCFVGPRNLPSTGFFPFLQTLMCNTDSRCHNKSRQVDPTASRTTHRSQRNARSTSLKGSPLADLLQGDFKLSFPRDSSNDPAALVEILNNIIGSSHPGRPNNVSFINATGSTFLGDQESLNKMLESMGLLKGAICTMVLPMINQTTPDHLSSAVDTFCKSNDTLLEVSLITLNEILMELMRTKPDEMATVAGMAIMLIDQLQNQTSLWDTLLEIPELISSGSVDQVLGSAEVLLTNIQSAMDFIENNFTQAGPSFSTVHPLLAGGINLLRYVQNWPGKDVSILLGDVVTLQNDSVSTMMKQVLQMVQIPLDKAIALTLDKDMVHRYLCDNSSNPLWLTAACSMGSVDTLLDWISPDLLAKHALLAWSEHVAPRDVQMLKGLLHSLMGGPSPGGHGGSSMMRTQRSVVTPPQTLEEELFLGVGSVVMEILKMVPEVDMILQPTLRAGFQSMQMATLTFDTVEEMMENVLKDAGQLKMTYQMLLTNQTVASTWIGRVLSSVMDTIMKTVTSQNATCVDLLGPFEWLLNTSTIEVKVWRSVICQNSSSAQQALLMDWLPVLQKAQEVYAVIMGQANYNVSLPMILSEWHNLYNSSMKFGALLNRVPTELGVAYWMNWMPENNTHDPLETLQQSLFLAVVNFGQEIERSHLWPVVKDYFHMAHWIMGYRPGVTTQPPNCSTGVNLAIHCDTNFSWPTFVQMASTALMSPNADVLVNCLKGTVNLLEHVYGDIFRSQSGSFLKQEIQGGDAFSAYLINLMNNLSGFVQNISALPDQSITNPSVTLPLIGNLLQSTGLSPLLPLFTSNGPLNVSTVINAAAKVGRLNQHIFTFNETDPTMPELERLILLFLSLEGNLTMSFSYMMGHTLLTYSDYFHPDYIARVREFIKPFTNQTSAGIVEAILSAMELLREVTDSADPTHIIVGYIHQLQEFVKSLYRLRKIEHFLQPSGLLMLLDAADLHNVSKDFLDLLRPDMLMNLTQAGPDAALDIVIERYLAFLPPELQQEAAVFLMKVEVLQYHLAKCASGQNCSAGIMGIFTFLDHIIDMMLSADVNVTINIAATNSVLVGRQYEELASIFFSLVLPPNGAAYVETFNRTLHLIRLLVAKPNISVSDVQMALKQSNLTIEELNGIAALAGAANINSLAVNIMAIINTRQCFEPQSNPMLTAQCVQGLVNRVSSFLKEVPALRNETAIFSLIPLIVNKTISDVMQVNFSNPHMAVVQTLNRTLANVKTSLQLNNLYTPEIMAEIRVLEGLIKLAANPEPINNFNSALMMDPTNAQQVYLTIIDWYLKRLVNITSDSSVSQLLKPFFAITQMQVTVQLAQTNFSSLVSNQVEHLMSNLQHPIDGAGVVKIGNAAVDILSGLFDVLKLNLEAQNTGPMPLFNSTLLNAIEDQVKQNLILVKMWINQPNVSSIFTSMLQWGNHSMDVSTPVKDFHRLLQTMVGLLSDDQQVYLSIISNITRIQLAQTNLTSFLIKQVAHLFSSLQNPIDGAGVVKIGNTTVDILCGLFKILRLNLEAQNSGPMPLFNSTLLNAIEDQVKQNLILVKMWINQPNVSSIFTSMLQWGNHSMDVSTPVKDFHRLLQTMVGLLSDDQQVYLSIISNITRIQLAQTNLTSFLIKQVAHLFSSLQNPIDGAGVVKIGNTTVDILCGLFKILRLNLEAQNSGPMPLFNSTLLNAIEDQVKHNLILVKRWINQPNVSSIITSMLQWGNHSMDVSTPVKDFHRLLQTMVGLLSDDQQVYLSIISNITQIQLAQTNLTSFLIKQVEHLFSSLQNPIDGAGVVKIGNTTVDILCGLFKILRLNLEAQNSGPMPLFNSTLLNAIEDQIKQNLSLIKMWINQPSVSSIITSMLQWGNPSINISTPVKDFHRLLQTMAGLFSNDQRVYLSIISNITRSLRKALMVAEQPGGLQSELFLSAILEAVQIAMPILAQDPLPLTVQRNIVEIVHGIIQLSVQPNMSFASSRNITVGILMKTDMIIQLMAPEVSVRVYLLAGVRVATTYFETITAFIGPDIVNQLILKQMKLVQSLLPPNSTAQTYVSSLINITHFILESCQGNMSLFAIFDNASAANLPMIFGKLSKLLTVVWPLVMGGPGSHPTAPSLESFAHLGPVLEQLMTGRADQDTWDKLKKMLEAVLLTLRGTDLWHSVPPAVSLFEKIIGGLVNNTKAETNFIQSLQMPVMILMKEIPLSVNSSHFNVSEFLGRTELAIERTVKAVEQANGTLECSEVLKLWEPVREAAGLSHDAIAVWCNTSLESVLEAYSASESLYAHMNLSHMGVGPMPVNATAAKVVNTIQSFYHVKRHQSRVAEHLIMTLCSHFYNLTGQPLSPEAQQHWLKQLQVKQLQNSLSSIKMLSDELLKVAPFLHPHLNAVEKAMSHILENYHRIQNNSSSQKLFNEAVMIYLHSANLTSTNTMMSMMWGNFSGLNAAAVTSMIKDGIKMMIDMKMFGDMPMAYDVLEQLLASNDTNVIAQKVAEMFEWFTRTQASGLELLSQALPRIHDIVRHVLYILNKMGVDLGQDMDMFDDIAGTVIAMLKQLVSSGLLGPMGDHSGMYKEEMIGGNPPMKGRHRREAPYMPMRDPMDDFIDLFSIDYTTMVASLSALPTTAEIMETVHVFVTNPDLGVVMKGATRGMPWGMNVSQEETIDASLGVLSYLTLPAALQMSPMQLLINSANMLPEAFPFSSVIKNITGALATESQENLILMQSTVQTVTELLQMSLTDPQFTKQLGHLKSQVCELERTQTVHQLMWALSVKPGQLCQTVLPGLEALVEGLMMNMTSLTNALLESLIGDPRTYNIHSDWTSVMSEGLNFNISSLSSLRVNITTPGAMSVGEMFRNKTAFILDVRKHMGLDPAVLHLLLETTVPKNNLEILYWLVKPCRWDPAERANMTADAIISHIFCNMSVEERYIFSLLAARHANVEKVLYRMVLSEEMQSLVGVMLQMAQVITNMMNKVLPAIEQLQTFMLSIKDLNLGVNNEFNEMARGDRSSISAKGSFVTLSRALCSHGILALFGISKLPLVSESNPSVPNDPVKEEMMERFKIPQNATPFCKNMYLDMVNTTGGAIAWAFLKPMLMGQILFTPDTPVTRSIMEKANATLQEFADLRKSSEEWIESSNYVIGSAEKLSQTLPMLQNSLGNSFVKNFIEMQTDINVGKMKETLSNFSNMTLMLEKNKHILKQITTLSTLMVDLSSCIKFDRYRGYNSTDKLDDVAQELAKNRDLYASVIFKLPKNGNSDSSSRKARSTSSTSSLPPKVSYTIRMHMDNVMRTDRVRNPYFVRDHHISARMTLRYNRGFIYLQENIDRAIIETQTGQRISEPAVQLQPFPYPCHLRDEYLEAISFVFPLMLMMAWVLFVADFVKKLVHERELRLHEYMKMMGVNPLSHFFAWFLECASYLVLTIIILTLVLKYGGILPHSNGFLLFLYLCDYGLSILAFSFLISSFFDKTYIAGLSGSLIYILCFFPFIVVMSIEANLSFSQKSALGLFSPTCYSYASQYISRYEAQGEGIQWSNSYTSPLAGDTSSFGWLCWLMFIDSILYFIIGAYIRMVFPGKYGIPSPWYFPFTASFWADLCCCIKSKAQVGRGLLFANIMQKNQPVFSDGKGKGQSTLSSQMGEDFLELPVGVALHGLSKIYGDRVAIQNLNVSFYEGHVTSLLGHNGAGKTTTMSLLTGLYAPTAGSIEVYGRDMQTNIDDVRKELGVCMQYDVLFEHMTAEEHLLLYGQIKAPQWSQRELQEQVNTILEETGMYAHRHKRVGTLSGGMKRKLSISIAFIGGSRLVVLDEPTTGVDPCSRRSIWDIVIQHKKSRTIIMSTHHLDEAEVLSDRIAFMERGGVKCCGSPLHLKDKLGQGYKLTLTKKMPSLESEQIDNAELKSFIQAHVPEARLKEAHGGDLVYSLPPFSSSNASSYRSLLTALDSNLDALQLGGYGISDTTLEEVFLQLTHDNIEGGLEGGPLSVSETLSDTGSISSFPSDDGGSISGLGDNIKLTGSSMVRGLALAWQQMTAILIKRFHHSRRDWKGLVSQILLPVLFVVFAMGLGSIKNDLQHYPELELSPALYKFGPSYSFFSNQNPNSSQLMDAMMSYPGMDNACLDKSDDQVCTRSTSKWSSSGNSSKAFSVCKCTQQQQVCEKNNFQPPHKEIPSSQIMYNLSGVNVENYLVATANEFIRNRYGGFAFGMPLPPDLQMDLTAVPKNRTLSKVWFNPEGHHTMPAYLNSLNNLILRSNLPADKDPHKYAISVSSHPYFGRADDEDVIVQGMLQILVAICVLTGYSITTASFAIYEVSEHHSGSKRLQHIAGISEPFYWAVNFFYDMVMYLIPVTLTVAVIAAFQIPAFTDRQNLGAITLLLVLFGFATFPWMYLLSGVFKDAEMAFITYMCINLFISVNTILSTSILYFLGQISVGAPELIQDIFKRLCYAFHIFPQFNFGNGMMQLARMNIEVQILSGYGIDAYKDPFSFDALGTMFIASFIEGLVFFILRLLLNKFLMRKIRHLICGRKTVPQVSSEGEDEDVAAEHLRVSSGAASSDILQVNQLTKVYQQFKKKVHAVQRISVGIPAGECFGLLGVNGAGKTTTFKMLTGDVSPTDGTAQIRDWDGRLVDIMECRNEGINIGYCPQVDALDNLLTGEEHLYFYGRIRGISKRELDGVVKYLLKRLELSYHRDIISDGYSCGTRRKLSTALALIGHPQILLLDEPSSGMDPRTKRHLWKIISEEVKGKCAVVLTSHSMEECEALCSRLAIMVKGQFRCLGSLQHIKNRFGSGFTVKMYLAEASCDTEAITGFMQRRFPSTYLKDQHSTMVEYHVPVAPGGVADIFDQLESNKNALQIKHFSVSQTTLDEVFINFAMGKIGMEDIPIHGEDDSDGLGSIKAVET